MPLPLGATVALSDEQEGWLPLSAPSLLGKVTQVLPGDDGDNPLYVVELREPIQVQLGGSLALRGLPPGAYQCVVIKSRWRGFDVQGDHSVSVHVVLPPPGAVAEGRRRLLQLSVAAWAGCRQISSEA